MLKARTEVTRKAESLPAALDEAVQAARRAAWEAERAGDAEQAELLYRRAWETLPEPRTSWDCSLIMTLDAISFHVEAARYADALRWLALADAASEGSQNSEVLSWSGVIAFEQGRLCEAQAAFAELYRAWGARAFRSLDPKYLAFYRRGTMSN